MSETEIAIYILCILVVVLASAVLIGAMTIRELTRRLSAAYRELSRLTAQIRTIAAGGKKE